MAKDAKHDLANPAAGGDIFDVRKIRRLIELMNEHDLNEIDLRDGDVRVRLRKGGEMMAVPMQAMGPGAAPAASSAPVAGPPAAAVENLPAVKSPMVGTFYLSANPETPPFVKVGDRVGKDSTVCIIEAMKVFNEIPAELSGKITAILVENGAPVEFGQPLFRIDPKG